MKLDSSPCAADSYRPRSLAEYRFRDMAPDSSRSGEHRVLQRYTATEEVSKVVKSSPLNEVPRPIAKAGPVPADRRELLNAEAIDRLRLGVDTLRRCGWSWDAIARHLGCTQTFLKDAYAGNRKLPAWLIDGLPEVQGVIAEKLREQLRKRAG